MVQEEASSQGSSRERSDDSRGARAMASSGDGFLGSDQPNADFPSGTTGQAGAGIAREDPTLSSSALSDVETEELREELAKVEEEIATLKQVLAAKEHHLAEIKQKLGIGTITELKANLSKGWQDVTSSSAYKKTSETLVHAGQKTTAAISSVGSVLSRTLGDVKNSPTFKSFEERVGSTVTGLKTRVSTRRSGSFEEVLSSTASASAKPDPEEKVPL